MKKLMILGAAVCVAMAFTGCKSSESAYKKAYEKAKSQERTGYNENATESSDVPVVAPVETQPVTETPVYDNYDNETVRKENVSVVSGSGLKVYSVVVGSFRNKANADGLQQRMRNSGYDAQLAYNSERDMYRVVASTYDSKASAVQSRNQLRSQFPDAWLLSK
ncbi:SPOR domain-containing protein [Prevotella sp. HUN102]|uniref:SPOR domain-containing protein n=1 Tax=Prevotella sp. HUN102 TaxID=1392486 RepID=UPI00048B6223|nr:SPOR domain-containing protein [Prevotella sp. HUN102]